MKIAILRHGKPELISKERIPAFKFVDWINRYNASSLSGSSVPDAAALACASECNVIVSSNLQRSIDSAKALDREKHLISDDQFIEAGMPSASWKILKMSPNTWAAIFRLMWLFGYSKNAESYKEAKQRASEAATKMIDLAQEHGQLIFVGHGIFNRILVKELKSRGWSGPKSPGSTYWSFEVYER